MKNFLREKAWSPYIAGIVVALLQIPAFLIIKTALGVSSSYVSAGGYIASIFDRTVMDNAYFNKYMTSMKYVWQSSLCVGIIIGAFLSRRLSGAKRQEYSPAWKKAVGIRTFSQRFFMGFIGGFVLLFGARWAGGCTTGHGLSGSAQLAVGSLVVGVMMFVGGIVVSSLYKKI
ncbi:MAG: YeeE/YedE family protein [Candidatus Omnitrophica bacterium]|nr:YeeE/YedE family protein [Candidatus Omnitrophota bacterium]